MSVDVVGCLDVIVGALVQRECEITLLAEHLGNALERISNLEARELIRMETIVSLDELLSRRDLRIAKLEVRLERLEGARRRLAPVPPIEVVQLAPSRPLTACAAQPHPVDADGVLRSLREITRERVS